MKWLLRLFRPSMTLIDLKGCAEIANGIEKYGSQFVYGQMLFLDVMTSPLANTIITGIEVPQEAYVIKGDLGFYMGKPR